MLSGVLTVRLQRWLLLCSLITAAPLVTRSAAAQSPPGDDARARARERFRVGVDAYTRGDYAAALEAFREAYRLAPHPSVLVNIANCHLQLHQPAEALTNFERFVAESPSVPAAQRREIERQITVLRAQVAQVRIRVAPETVSDARITIDGQSVASNDSIRVNPGRHTVEVSATGFETERNEIEASAGTRADVWVRLRPLGTAPIASRATGDARTNQTTGTTSPSRAGEGVTSQSATGATVSASPSSVDAPSRTDRVRRGLSPALFFAGVTATSVAAVSWAVFGLLATNANATFNDAANNIHAGVGSYEAEYTRGMNAAANARTFAIVSDVSLGLALAGAVTSVVLFTQTNFGSRAVVVTPTASATDLGVSLGGRF